MNDPLKNKIQISQAIISIENRMAKEFPELLKYILEMPVKMEYNGDEDVQIKNLNDYYNSLTALIDHYAISHKKTTS